MPPSTVKTVADEISDVRECRPHVVVLGAGASRAACPAGDKNGLPLPVMADFAQQLELEELFREWKIDPAANFEDTYSSLYDARDEAKIVEINGRVERHFSSLELPDEPTIYDHLVLSLRQKDIVATFNWDPFLIQAFRRVGRLGMSMPKLAFLHGSVLSAFCERDKVMGVVGRNCSQCGRHFSPTPLLYPVRHKNYAEHPGIAAAWELFRHGLREAMMITVFGYSGPKTDVEAISAMSDAWGPPPNRAMEQTEFISLQSDREILENWNRFIHSHHYDLHNDFYSSWIAKHPRRTVEAHIAQYFDAQFIEENPVPRLASFSSLDDWLAPLLEAERAGPK